MYGVVRDLLDRGRIRVHPLAVKGRLHEPPLATPPLAVQHKKRIESNKRPQKVAQRLARAERVWVGSEDFLDRLWVREGNDGRLTRHARGIAVAVAQALRHSRVRVEGITQHLQDGRRARPRR